MGIKVYGDHSGEYPLILAYWNVEEDGTYKGKLELSGTNEIFDIIYPLPLIQKSETYSESKIFLFKNKFGNKEDQHYSIILDENRIGKIFPIKVFSNPGQLPEPGEDPFLYRFLHIAFYHLLDGTHIPERKMSYQQLSGLGSTLSIEHLYDEETVVLLYHNPKDKKFEFDIYSLLAPLLKLGYVPITEPRDFADIEQINATADKSPLYNLLPGDNLNFKTPKNELWRQIYIQQVLTSFVKYPTPPLIKFILLYQVIELLIDKIAVEDFLENNPFDASMSVKMINTKSAASFRDILENVSAIQTRLNSISKKENARINVLFDGRSKLKISDYPLLTDQCTRIIGNLGIETVSDHIYQLRNKVVHAYHKLAVEVPNIDDLLSQFNLSFELLIADILIKFEDK